MWAKEVIVSISPLSSKIFLSNKNITEGLVNVHNLYTNECSQKNLLKIKMKKRPIKKIFKYNSIYIALVTKVNTYFFSIKYPKL